MKKIRCNTLNNSQIEIFYLKITDLGLCDLLVRNYTALKIVLAKNTHTEILTIQSNMEKRLKKIEIEYNHTKTVSKSFAWLAIIMIIIASLFFILNDLRTFYEYNKYQRTKEHAKQKYIATINNCGIRDKNLFRSVLNKEINLFKRLKKKFKNIKDKRKSLA